jgi:hypothetical protein
MPRKFDHDHTLPFLGVCASDDRDRHDVAPVDREVRYSRRDVHEIAGSCDGPFHESVAVPDFSLAAHSVDG